MSPLTRSSPATPAKSSIVVTPTPTRRTPHCTKCHRPRAGHPRSGCPYVDASDSPQPTENALSEEFSSLRIVSPTEESKLRVPLAGNKLKRRLSVRFALVPEKTLASLSPTDTQLVEQLLQPGMISNTVTPEDRVAHVLKWRKTLDDVDPLDERKGESVDEDVKTDPASANTTTLPLSRSMPCTFSAPTASLTTTEPVSDQHIGGSAINMNDTIYLLPDLDAKKSTPLSRSMSFEQRSLFLQRLSLSSSTPPATLFSIQLADLDSVQSDAQRIGFYVRVLPSQEENIKWVVLGTEEEAVNLLAEKFLEQEKKSTTAKEKGGNLTAVAGAVVFGAVATWTGLAFS